MAFTSSKTISLGVTIQFYALLITAGRKLHLKQEVFSIVESSEILFGYPPQRGFNYLNQN
jgi:hypothetical protein